MIVEWIIHVYFKAYIPQICLKHQIELIDFTLIIYFYACMSSDSFTVQIVVGAFRWFFEEHAPFSL